MMELGNSKKMVELYQMLRNGHIEFQSGKPVIIDSSLALLLGVYGMDGVITVEMEGAERGADAR